MNMLQNSIILLCLLFAPGSLYALWSGVRLSLGDETIPVVSDAEALVLTPYVLTLEVEDKTAQGLRIGAGFSRIGVRLKGDAIKAESSGDALGLYLYFPYSLNHYVEVVSRLSLLLVDTLNDNSQGTGVEYLSKTLSIGLALKWHNMRLISALNVRSIEGDFVDNTEDIAFGFQQKNTRYTHFSFDYFVEKNSFVRLSLSEHSDNTFRIDFATIY